LFLSKLSTHSLSLSRWFIGHQLLLPSAAAKFQTQVPTREKEKIHTSAFASIRATLLIEVVFE
jgi:hypothetical protein